MSIKENLIRRVTIMKYAMWLVIGVAVLTTYFSYILGQQVNSRFYFGFLSLVVYVPAILFFRDKVIKYSALYDIKDNWGKSFKRKRKFDDIRKLYELTKKENELKFTIDNQTWEDFTMNKIFERVDSTLSSPGEQVLYSILRTPEFDEEVLIKRNKLINLFQRDSAIREKLQTELYLLSRQQINTIGEFLWEELPKRSAMTVLFNIMGVLPIVLAALMPFYGLKAGGVFIFVVFTANMYIHSKFRKKINLHLDSMSYLSAVVNTAKNIKETQHEALKEYLDYFQSVSGYVKSSKTAGILASIEGVDAVTDYFNILFLVKERKFYSVLEEVREHRDELKELYIKVGELDALISVASYRESLGSYTEPKLKKEGRFIRAINLTHPLIDAPVPNSIVLENRGIVLTGSNMSGKSTFLRTVGVNALLAQTIYTCSAESYSGSYFKILSSISPSDDLTSGKSYYLGEAEAVLRIIRSCSDDIPCLSIIDEIFRGTNPIERIGASAEILDYLISNNSLPIVATHDLELTEIVDVNYECYYFTEYVDEEGLKFDYKIRKGVSPTRNAIKLLKYLGYPEDIIENTYKRVDILFGK
jgi:DNA mismatch repair ATPase MutS